MSLTYTKLFSSITESTVWIEPYATRIVWVSMLAMCDRKGRVFASVPGLAKRAGVTRDECEAALVTFLSPDRDSRTTEFEGRRIEPIDGGWRLINYRKYREARDEDERREYQREWDRNCRVRPINPTNPTNPTESDQVRPQPTQAEAEAEAVKAKTRTTLSGASRADVAPNGEIPLPNPKAGAREILEFLNAKAGRAFPMLPANLDLIAARLKDGATVGQCRQVIAKKVREWGGDAKMAEFLRPKTLFNKTNFANYLGELVVPVEGA